MALEVRAARHEELPLARRLIQEYVDSLGVDLGFQEIDKELRDFPGAYAPPTGAILLAFVDGEPAGCVGLRPFEGDCCEMKRLYVRPGFRGAGAGRALAAAVVEAARVAGYARMRLDTQPGMEAAQALYQSLGFREIAPYRFNPIEGTTFMELKVIPPPE
jgi:ribosomal protein S18 acetylase RimI-like enzyme